MNTTSNRRWFSFSLRTLLAVVTLCGTVGYWAVCKAKSRMAEQVYQNTLAAYDADTILARDLYEASLQLLDAELNVPLADRQRATLGHLARMDLLRRKCSNLCTMDVNNTRLVEIDGYYAQAQRLVSKEL